ncbi:Nif3-like dinuclear metal center hexameric protein [Brachybacterium sp. J153]|uniref:Nif3-like dinuclear metal center hexameric protein n=1 Tax=Brachybacterium sp. J153 TaxID=3116488 RepID=UPI002E7871B6|nr:Nif3-like dinuclear metal center hexameric protein [Brachybacterium sp. J153]MEE1617340.1 Nif3-like dinuclear metal center hexameric protein [Brachybacterium sp. J153]
MSPATAPPERSEPSAEPATTVGSLVTALEATYPLPWAEDWDRVGLVLGERGAEVTAVHLAVDPTLAVAREAIAAGAQLLVTHHPLLLRGASHLPADDGKGAVVTALLRAGTALWCGHTNVDRSTHGTVGAWVRSLDLQQVRALVPSGAGEEAAHGSSVLGLGVVGELPEHTTVGDLAARVAALVPATARGILHTGDPDRPVRTVAVCPGAGDSFTGAAASAEADVYITSDLRHHPVLEHLESAADAERVPALIDVPHGASEALWLPLAEQLLGEIAPGLKVTVSALPVDPWAARIG